MTKPLTGYELENAILRHEANTDAELIEEFKGLVNRAKQAIERVRELHKPIEEVNVNGFVNIVCNGCFDEEPSTGQEFHHHYPCNTIKVLDGDD
jgi:hypothetical protein